MTRQVGRRSFKKLINDPFDVVDEALEGFVAAHSELIARPHPRVIVRREPASGKVGLVVGGGSGHEPAFAGYVGRGLADAAACGNIFASPSADIILAAIKAADHGRGVVLAYGNYAGDVMNFGLAAQLAIAEGIDVRQVRVSDDVASAPKADAGKRRGIAGDVIVFKCAGAAAEEGWTVDDVERIAARANAATRSMGVALSACEVPGSGGPTFEVADDEMEIGMGVHGEPGITRGPLRPADEVARTLVDTILADVDDRGAREVALLVNGLGSTAYVDQYVLYRGARRALEAAGLRVVRSYVGEFITSLEMAGASVTVSFVDGELLALLDAPAKAPSFNA
ncbi:MAG TPA: dihydroxyacetone kinase subunit DhaK [Candidatus Limnocylindrales bacterium]|nr:dihydroxyacetone kinase subunit DhaK [Candidatus Limnocylindrales bacterium]